jgi:hypothetical protein
MASCRFDGVIVLLLASLCIIIALPFTFAFAADCADGCPDATNWRTAADEDNCHKWRVLISGSWFDSHTCQTNGEATSATPGKECRNVGGVDIKRVPYDDCDLACTPVVAGTVFVEAIPGTLEGVGVDSSRADCFTPGS